MRSEQDLACAAAGGPPDRPGRAAARALARAVLTRTQALPRGPALADLRRDLLAAGMHTRVSLGGKPPVFGRPAWWRAYVRHAGIEAGVVGLGHDEAMRGALELWDSLSRAYDFGQGGAT